MKKLNGAVEFKKDLSKAEVERVAKDVKKFADVNGEIWGWYYSYDRVEILSYAMVMYEKGLHMSIEEGYDEVELLVNHVAITTDDAMVIVAYNEDGEQYMLQFEDDDFLDEFAKTIKKIYG